MTLAELIVKEHGAVLDLAELAALLKITKQSMYQQIYQGKLDIDHVKRGKKYLFLATDVADYLQEKKSVS
jgi:hypothetical protein